MAMTTGQVMRLSATIIRAIRLAAVIWYAPRTTQVTDAVGAYQSEMVLLIREVEEISREID